MKPSASVFLMPTDLTVDTPSNSLSALSLSVLVDDAADGAAVAVAGDASAIITIFLAFSNAESEFTILDCARNVFKHTAFNNNDVSVFKNKNLPVKVC